MATSIIRRGSAARGRSLAHDKIDDVEESRLRSHPQTHRVIAVARARQRESHVGELNFVQRRWQASPAGHGLSIW
jgi:hypothetical protein